MYMHRGREFTKKTELSSHRMNKVEGEGEIFHVSIKNAYCFIVTPSIVFDVWIIY